MDPSFVASSAALAMVLEVSADPKPGNVDRGHSRGQTRYEHFVASALASVPALRGAARERRRLGHWFHQAVAASVRSQPGGNTHFGTLLLLVPLAAAAGAARRPGHVLPAARTLLRRTTVADGVEFYRAFRAAPVRVAPFRGPLDLRSPRAEEVVRRTGTTLYRAVTLAADRDRVAREWGSGFAESAWARSRLSVHLARRDWNEAVVRTYLDLLARAPDSLVATEFGPAAAREVQRTAAPLRGAPMERIARWDGQLVRRGVNPGATADILAAGIFLWLMGR